MKKGISIILLIMIFPLVMFSQKRDSLKFIEIGIGAGYSPNLHGAINGGIAVNLNNYIVNFIEYNMFFSNSSIYCHENIDYLLKLLFSLQRRIQAD